MKLKKKEMIEAMIVASRARDPLNPSRRGPCARRMVQKLEINSCGVSNTLSTVAKDNYLVLSAIASVMKENVLMKKEMKSKTTSCEQKKRKHGLQAEMLHLDNLPEELKGKKVYIRKLTPRECFRLMDVTEENIDKMMLPKDENGKPVISNTQLYKLAGNSIVVSCMEYMFRNLLFGPSEQDKQELNKEYPIFKGSVL